MYDAGKIIGLWSAILVAWAVSCLIIWHSRGIAPVRGFILGCAVSVLIPFQLWIQTLKRSFMRKRGLPTPPPKGTTFVSGLKEGLQFAASLCLAIGLIVVVAYAYLASPPSKYKDWALWIICGTLLAAAVIAVGVSEKRAKQKKDAQQANTADREDAAADL